MLLTITQTQLSFSNAIKFITYDASGSDRSHQEQGFDEKLQNSVLHLALLKTRSANGSCLFMQP